MLDITVYLVTHPLVGVGLGLLVLLCIYNVLRAQVRVALGLWLMTLAVLFFVYLQAGKTKAPEEQGVVPPPVVSP